MLEYEHILNHYGGKTQIRKCVEKPSAEPPNFDEFDA
jgi:hypothetical protein